MFVLVLSAALAAPLASRPTPHAVARTVAATPAPRSDELFSRRARRRFAAYLRMRLLEMRVEGLERAAEAVERSRPARELLDSR